MTAELEMPYFMENKSWYRFAIDESNPLDGHYELTEAGKALPEVVKSYDEYQTAIDDDEGLL